MDKSDTLDADDSLRTYCSPVLSDLGTMAAVTRKSGNASDPQDPLFERRPPPGQGN